MIGDQGVMSSLVRFPISPIWAFLKVNLSGSDFAQFREDDCVATLYTTRSV